MSGNTIGKIFRVTTFGESHGPATGGVIDGCPSGLKLDMDTLRLDLVNRKAVKAIHSTSRFEDDEVQFLSGIHEGITTGAPIAFIVQNQQQDPGAYTSLAGCFRPGHGDFAWFSKYHHYDHRGGGRYSARETLARVVAGSIAKQLLSSQGIRIQGWVSGIGEVQLPGYGPYNYEKIVASEVKCPEPGIAELMTEALTSAAACGDTLGGSVSVRVDGLMPGLGEPVFDKIEALLALAVMSIPAAKAFEIGDGFDGVLLRGSEQNDLFSASSAGQIEMSTNHAGGTLGGLSSGNPLLFRVGFKPVSSLKKVQNTVTKMGAATTIDLTGGRHDVCVVPRAVAVVEAMTAITLADLWLRNRCSRLNI